MPCFEREKCFALISSAVGFNTRYRLAHRVLHLA